jgi:hypothetical protein
MIQQQLDAEGANVISFAVSKVINPSDLPAQKIGDAANAEIWIGVGDRDRDLPVRGQFARSQSGADPGIATAHYEKLRHFRISSG